MSLLHCVAAVKIICSIGVQFSMPKFVHPQHIQLRLSVLNSTEENVALLVSCPETRALQGLCDISLGRGELRQEALASAHFSHTK